MTSCAQTPPVNRYLEDEAMDRIDHALGRPVDPMKSSYRSHYATDRNGAHAGEMRASPNWEEGRGVGDLAFFYVTSAGRAALAEHLKAIGDRNRLYEVSIRWDGAIHPHYVVAPSRGRAKYAAWLDISDSYCELAFGAFARMVASVRLA